LPSRTSHAADTAPESGRWQCDRFHSSCANLLSAIRDPAREGQRYCNARRRCQDLLQSQLITIEPATSRIASPSASRSTIQIRAQARKSSFRCPAATTAWRSVSSLALSRLCRRSAMAKPRMISNVATVQKSCLATVLDHIYRQERGRRWLESRLKRRALEGATPSRPTTTTNSRRIGNRVVGRRSCQRGSQIATTNLRHRSLSRHIFPR